MTKRSEKKQQHIVSAVLLKQFKKEKKDIILDTEILGNRLVFDRHSKNEYPKQAFYKIFKDDFMSKNEFILHRENIIKPDDRSNKICYEHIYSINNEQQDIFNKKFNITDHRDPYDIKYLIEDSLGKTETKISLFYNYINIHGLNNSLLRSFDEEIISFVSTNELRSLHMYKILKNDIDYNSKTSYIVFDKTYFCNFISLYTDMYFDKIDYYERIDVHNYLNGSGLLQQTHDYAEFIKKTLIKLGIDNIDKKHYMIINNKSDLKFILSDVATSIFYDNNKCFINILKLIDFKNIYETPSKITIMPLTPTIAIILSDKAFNQKYVEIENSEKIKKFNSIFFSTNNEWLVVYDVSRKRDQILNEIFLEKIKKHERLSNALKWIKNGLEKESYSNSKFNYEKATYKMYKSFSCLFIILNNIKQMHSFLKFQYKEETIFLEKINKKITFSNIDKNNEYNLNVFKEDSFIMYIKEKKIYDFFNKLSEIQFNCLKLIFIREKILTDFYIDYKNQRLVCLNFNFKLKT